MFTLLLYIITIIIIIIIIIMQVTCSQPAAGPEEHPVIRLLQDGAEQQREEPQLDGHVQESQQTGTASQTKPGPAGQALIMAISGQSFKIFLFCEENAVFFIVIKCN